LRTNAIRQDFIKQRVLPYHNLRFRKSHFYTQAESDRESIVGLRRIARASNGTRFDD